MKTFGKFLVVAVFAFSLPSFSITCAGTHRSVNKKSLIKKGAVTAIFAASLMGGTLSHFIAPTSPTIPTGFKTASVNTAKEIPKGFEASGLLPSLLKGEVKVDRILDTNQEGKFILRSFYPGTTAEEFLAPALDYKTYPSLNPGVVSAEELSTNADGTQRDYKLVIEGAITLFGKKIGLKPTKVLGRHTVSRSEDGETILRNDILNPGRDLQFVNQSTRLVPYEGGLLVEDTIHAKTTKSSVLANLIKTILINKLTGITQSYREVILSK